MKRETLNALFTARADRLPCASGYGYAVKLGEPNDVCNKTLRLALERAENCQSGVWFSCLDGQILVQKFSLDGQILVQKLNF